MTGHITYTSPEGQAVTMELHRIERISERPIYSPDDVNAAYVEVSLTLVGYFSDVTDTDWVTKSKLIEKVLQTPRGDLLIASVASPAPGQIWYDVKPSAADRDLNTGPKPRALEIQRVIGTTGAWVTWTVEFAVLRCDITNVTDLPKLLYKTYSVDFDFGSDGTLIRTITGEARIPDITNQATNFGKTAQKVIESIYIVVPRGWRRVSARFVVAPNGLVVNYTFVDQELEIGWNEFVADMSASWEEQGDIIPRTATCSVRLKGKRHIKKRDLLLNVLEPMIRTKFAAIGEGRVGPTRQYQYREDLLTNEIEASVTKMVVPLRGGGDLINSTPLVDGSIPVPSGVFGTNNSAIIGFGNPIQIPPNATPTHMDNILLSKGNARRWKTLPLLSRLIIKGLCERTALTAPNAYEQDIQDTTLVLTSHQNQLTEEQPSPFQTAHVQLYNEQLYRPTWYIMDREVIVIRFEQFVHVLGNTNLIAINEQGAIDLEPERSQRAYQSNLPVIEVLVVGQAMRPTLMPEPRPIPTIKRKGSNQVLKMMVDKCEIRTFGPEPYEGGMVPAYGVMWSYRLLKELSSEDFTVDPVTLITNLVIPEQTSRASRIWTDGVQNVIQWGNPFS